MSSDEFVRMEGITKRFGDVLALDRVDFGIRKGEVHSLLGENGAGKTTLMNVLYGLYRANEGRIEIGGREVVIRSPRDALENGIGMVHQHFRLVSNFTAFENILLGTGKGPRFDSQAQRQKTTRIAEEYGLAVDLEARVKSLPVGAQQRVEILKVLTRDPHTLILDEPTSSLTPQEADALLAAVKKLAARGLAIVLITHKVREVLETADRITVLRAGKVMGILSVAEAGENRLVQLMMGGKEAADSLLLIGGRRAEAAQPKREPLLTITSLTVGGGRRAVALGRVDLVVNRGEILGVAGVSGNGQRELAEAVMSVRRADSGSVKLEGVELTSLDTRKIISMGVRYIPEDRTREGILPTMSVAENLVLSRHRSAPFCRGFAVDRRTVDQAAADEVEEYRVKAPTIGTHAGLLSGGNMQKLLIARALMTQARLVVAHNPTRGLDIATTDLVLKNLIKQKEGGAGVILISEDLDELMTVSDRICVLYKGEVMGVVESKEFGKYVIGAMMAGQAREVAAR